MVYALTQARVFTRSIRKLALHRFHHSATGRFITISPQGTPVARPIEVWLGGQGHAYVMFDPEITQAFRAGIMPQDGCSFPQDQELLPLTFNHENRQFSHKSSPYPHLEIPEELSQQSNTKNSLATLHAYGVTHAITLDGTADAGFHHSIRESIQRLQPIFDELKHT